MNEPKLAERKKTYEELERENAELRAKLAKSENLIARTLTQIKGKLEAVDRHLAEPVLKV